MENVVMRNVKSSELFADWLEECGRAEKQDEARNDDFLRIIRLGASADEVTDVLGDPDYLDVDSIVYDLGVRSNHVFEFVTKSGKVVWASYRNKDRKAIIDSLGESTHGSSFSRKVRCLNSANADMFVVAELLGQPDEKFGWWPVEYWRYPRGGVEFRIGILGFR